jgi:TPR repeat protein
MCAQKLRARIEESFSRPNREFSFELPYTHNFDEVHTKRRAGHVVRIVAVALGCVGVLLLSLGLRWEAMACLWFPTAVLTFLGLLKIERAAYRAQRPPGLWLSVTMLLSFLVGFGAFGLVVATHCCRDSLPVGFVRLKAAFGSKQDAFCLGNAYREGLYGRTKSPAEAVRWYRTAAEDGHIAAMVALAGMGFSKDGVEGGVDPTESAKWARMAAKAGDANGMFFLAAMYEIGQGVTKDNAEAVRWYREAAEAGNAAGMRSLGLMYENGRGVAKDYTEAVQWYRKAAEARNTDGMWSLGLMYENGRGVAKDDAEAVQWYRRAAEARNTYGMWSLGLMYETGRGVAKNDAEAVRWYRKAAEAENAFGMCNLGAMYANGRGVAKDDVEAAKWYRKAADAGNEDAIKALKRMGK